MAVVHYKFKNSVEYDSLTFDGLSISLKDLKVGIMKKKKMRAEDNDLQVVNAQTGEVYSSPSLMIPKNTSLTISRIPVGGTKKVRDDSAQAKAQKWAAFRKETQAAISAAETGGFNTEKIKQSSDLVNAQSSEIEKIAEMMKQSTKDFDPANYTYKFPTGVPNSSYICRKCGKGGHYIQNCTNEPLEGANSPSDVPRMKRPTGIPVDSMVFVNEPLPGTYQTHSGKYAVPKIDVAAYVEGKKERPPFLPEVEKKQVTLKKPIPKELKCPLCGDLAKDAVVIPCCGISYCDECIRNKLLESEDHVCPSCDSMDVSPDGLIANQMLRRAVTNFQNETGYVNIKQAQMKAVEAAKAAAAATQVLKMQGSVIPRGPSVLDYKPPPKPPTPPPSQPAPSVVKTQPPISVTTSMPNPMRVNVTPQKSHVPTLAEQEPPTPTQDEPIRSSSYTHHPHVSSSATQNISTGEPLQTVVGQTVQPVNRNQRRPATSTGFDPYYKPSITTTSVPPPAVPPYPPPTAFPPPGVPPPFVGPPVLPIVRPPIVPPVVPPGFPAALPPRPAVPAPPINMPKPLSETEFLEEKNRILREELDKKEKDPLLEFAKKLEQRKVRSFKSRSRSRSPRPRSRSLSRPRYRSRSRGRSYSRSPRRSYTPRRSSLSPRRSYSPRRYSPRRSRSPRYSPKRYYSPRRSRSPRRSLSPRPRYRSYSRSPVRRRSFSRSRSRDRRRSPYRRSISRSPISRRSPFRRSYSRGRYTPPRSLSPYRRSPFRRSRSRGRSPIDQYRRSRSPMRYSPIRKRSPLRRSKSPFSRSPIRRSKSPLKRSPGRKMKDKPLSRPRSPKQSKDAKKKVVPDKLKDKERKDSEISDNVNNDKQTKSTEPNKENIPSKPVNSRSNNILINIVDSTTDDNSEVEGKTLKNDGNQNENAVSNKSFDKTEKSAVESKDGKSNGESENKQASKNEAEVKLKSRSRSKSKEKSVQSSRQSKPKKKRSPKRKEKSVSLSPERVKSPLRMPYRDRFDVGRGERFDAGRGDRFDSGRGRMEGGRDRFEGGRGVYGRDWDRNRDADPYYRARQNVGYRGRDYRGRGRGSDFRGGEYRGQQPPDFRNDYRPPQAPGDFGAYPPLPDPAAMGGPYNRDYPQRGSPGYPPNYGPNFPYPPPRDPREDPNWQGLVRDEDIVKFEQYKQLYDFYSNSRTYGFPPSSVANAAPSGQTPPQGPPPAPPGTTPILSPPERGGSPGRRRSLSPRRHRSRSPRRDGKERRERERDYRDKRSPTERRKDDREERSPNRKRDYSPEKKITTDESRDETSPEKKSKDTEKEARKDKKAKRKKEKAEGVEKKKKKKKDKEKIKSKKEKGEKKEKKNKVPEQSENEEQVTKKSKLSESQNETDTEKSDSDTEVKAKVRSSRQNSTAQSDLSENEEVYESKTKKKIKKESKDEDESDTKRNAVRSESDHGEKNSPDNLKQEVASEDERIEPVKEGKRRSIKRGKPDAEIEQATEAKKAKLEEAVIEETKVEKMETSGNASPAGSEGLDDIPQPEDELMLDPPELSKWEKWEKDDDPYDLSPEPSKAKEKWKPGKQTFLPRSVIEKAEHALAQKVMKPTSVSSSVSVIQTAKKETKSETKEVEPVQSKREKSPVVESKRRVFVEPDKKRDERRVATKQQHSVKITVTGDEKRKVATGNDLRNKLREKRRESEHSRDYDRSREKDRERSPERCKRKDSHGFRDRRSSRDYDRHESRGSAKDSDRGRAVGRTVSRKDSVIDDSRFVPDYDDDESLSEDDNSEDSSSDSSSDEEVAQRRHKHKKNKHKKEKKQKKKKEKKKKKHKIEKEKKIKSSIGK